MSCVCTARSGKPRVPVGDLSPATIELVRSRLAYFAAVADIRAGDDPRVREVVRRIRENPLFGLKEMAQAVNLGLGSGLYIHTNA
jgi:hypothetical protein